MKVFWMDDALCLQPETEQERKALGIVYLALDHEPRAGRSVPQQVGPRAAAKDVAPGSGNGAASLPLR
jgi:hypothetical protein